MTARASIKQADLRRMAAVAKQEGVSVEVDIEGRTYRVRPENDDNDNHKNSIQTEIIRL